MTYLELSVYGTPCLMISFQPLCCTQSLATWTAPLQHSEWKQEGKRVSDRSSRKIGQEITHWATSWQHSRQCCSGSSYGGQGQEDPCNIYRCHHRQEWKRPLHHCHTTRHPVNQVCSSWLFAVNSCWRTVTLTRINMFHFVKPWNVHLADKDFSNVTVRPFRRNVAIWNVNVSKLS